MYVQIKLILCHDAIWQDEKYYIQCKYEKRKEQALNISLHFDSTTDFYLILPQLPSIF